MRTSETQLPTIWPRLGIIAVKIPLDKHHNSRRICGKTTAVIEGKWKIIIAVQVSACADVKMLKAYLYAAIKSLNESLRAKNLDA